MAASETTRDPRTRRRLADGWTDPRVSPSPTTAAIGAYRIADVTGEAWGQDGLDTLCPEQEHEAAEDQGRSAPDVRGQNPPRNRRGFRYARRRELLRVFDHSQLNLLFL